MFLNSLQPCPEYCSKWNSFSLSAFIQQTWQCRRITCRQHNRRQTPAPGWGEGRRGTAAHGRSAATGRAGAPRARRCYRFTVEGVEAVPRPAGRQQGASLWSCPHELFHAHSGGLHPPGCPVSSVSVGDGQHASHTTTRWYWGSAHRGQGSLNALYTSHIAFSRNLYNDTAEKRRRHGGSV